MDNHDNEDQQPFLLHNSEKDLLRKNEHSQHANSFWTRHSRTLLEILMACAIAFLSVYCFLQRPVRSSPVPTFPHKTIIFNENTRYLREDMFVNETETLHTLHNWLELSADGRGYVKVDDAESFDLGEPYELQIDANHTEPVYMMSVFHQLHCLSYLVHHFQRGYGGFNLTEEVAHHTAHCFDNIRQVLMCAGDTSLEGKTETPGWGAKHMCKDYGKILEWANEHTVYRWHNAIMPDEAIL